MGIVICSCLIHYILLKFFEFRKENEQLKRSNWDQQVLTQIIDDMDSESTPREAALEKKLAAKDAEIAELKGQRDGAQRLCAP